MLKRITNDRKRVLSIFQIGAFFCQRMFSEIEEIVKSIFREFLPLEKMGCGKSIGGGTSLAQKS